MPYSVRPECESASREACGEGCSAQAEIRRGSVSRHAVVRTVELSNGHDRRVLRMNAGSSV